jgi:hypothetical protein
MLPHFITGPSAGGKREVTATRAGNAKPSSATATSKQESLKLRKSLKYQEKESDSKARIKECERDITKLLYDRNELTFELESERQSLDKLLSGNKASDVEAEVHSFATRAKRDYPHEPRLHIEYPKARQQQMHLLAHDSEAWIHKVSQVPCVS